MGYNRKHKVYYKKENLNTKTEFSFFLNYTNVSLNISIFFYFFGFLCWISQSLSVFWLRNCCDLAKSIKSRILYLIQINNFSFFFLIFARWIPSVVFHHAEVDRKIGSWYTKCNRQGRLSDWYCPWLVCIFNKSAVIHGTPWHSVWILLRILWCKANSEPFLISSYLPV